MEQYRMQQERLDRRVALIAWVQVETNRNTDARAEPFELEEVVSWLGHGFQHPRTSGGERGSAPPASASPQETACPSTEAIMEQAHLFMQLYSQQKTNGTPEDG